MLTPEQIAALRDKAGQITDPVVEFLIADIADRISEAGQLTSTASYEIWKAQKLGVSQKQLKKELQKRLKVSRGLLEQLLTQAAEVGYDFDLKRFPSADAVPFDDNASLQQILDAAIQQAQEDFTNITQTMGFVGPNGKAMELTEAYQKACDFVFEKVATGAQDYNSAIRAATKGLAEKGILSLDYASGVHTSLEAAARRNMMGGLGIMVEQITQQNHDMLGCDGWEISAHMGSAPDHEPIQGKQYSDEDYTRLNNSLVRRIGTLNCGHSAMPVILGVNDPQYTAEELEEFREKNEAGITYEGKRYTLYEASQRQRRLETSIRNYKRRILIDKHLGDKEALQNDQIRLVRLREEYNRFSKAAGLPVQHERMEAAGFTWKHGKAAENAVNTLKNANKTVAKTGSRGIINTRGLAMSLRTPKTHILSDEEIRSILEDAKELGIDEKLLRFNKGYQTGFSDERGCINIRGDILPDPRGITARDRMSQRAVLAHEYYGHYLNHPSEYPIGHWKDEFRASYDAAVKAPNLSDEERRDLMIDAYDRAKEAGEFTGYDETARRIIYGF